MGQIDPLLAFSRIDCVFIWESMVQLKPVFHIVYAKIKAANCSGGDILVKVPVLTLNLKFWQSFIYFMVKRWTYSVNRSIYKFTCCNKVDLNYDPTSVLLKNDSAPTGNYRRLAGFFFWRGGGGKGAIL